jgi:hypothetical protein
LSSSLTAARKPASGLGFGPMSHRVLESARCPIRSQFSLSENKKIPLECGIANGETRTRTGDTTIFSRAVLTLERRRNACKRAVLPRPGTPGELRKFRPFPADSGDDRHLISQCAWSRASRQTRSETAVGRADALQAEVARSSRARIAHRTRSLQRRAFRPRLRRRAAPCPRARVALGRGSR